MSTYTDNRSRYLAVEGGTITFEKPCLCYARDAMQHEPQEYRWRGGVLWGLWPVCPSHGHRFMSPVWTARMGRLHDEPATVSAAPVQIED